MSKNIKLKNCPFCGGKAYLIQRKNKAYDIGCENMMCNGWTCLNKSCDCKDGYVSKEDAIEWWNIRIIKRLEKKLVFKASKSS